jgi:hypothetical protein
VQKSQRHTVKRSLSKNLLFTRGCQALTAFTGEKQDKYCCPICENLYGYEDVEAGPLTSDHVPAKSRGGKELVLTCRSCNSYDGHALNSEVLKREYIFDFEEALLGRRSIFSGRAKAQFGDQILNVHLSIKGETNVIDILADQNSPINSEKVHAYFKSLIEEGKGEGETFKIALSAQAKAWMSDVGDLRTAYLAVFALMGYTYALDTRLDKVRQQIRKPTEKIMNGFWSRVSVGESERNVMGLLNEPFPLLLVQLGRSRILLPRFEGPLDTYERLDAIDRGRKPINLLGQSLRWPVQSEFALDFKAKGNASIR